MKEIQEKFKHSKKPLTTSLIASFFNLSPNNFSASTAKKRYLGALEKFYHYIKENEEAIELSKREDEILLKLIAELDKILDKKPFYRMDVERLRHRLNKKLL